MSRAKYVTVAHATGGGVAERWRAAYFAGGRWFRVNCGDAEGIYNRLCDLGLTPDVQAVADVVGGKSWTHIMCDGCSEYVEVAVLLGKYEPKKICPACVREAAFALQALK